MSDTFRQVDRDTLFLLPPSMDDWLPEGHWARFVVEIAGQLGLDIESEINNRKITLPYPEMHFKFVGFGGQAVLSLGMMLAQMAMLHDLEVT